MRELERLTRTVGWLVGMVGRLVAVQAGLLVAVERLEGRTRPAGGRHARPRLRLLVRAVDMTLGMLVLALVFGVGQGLLPGGSVPPAAAGPERPERKRTSGVATTTTGPAGRSGRSGWGHQGGQPAGGQVLPAAQQTDRTLAGPTSTTSTTLTPSSSTTSTILPVVVSSTTVLHGPPSTVPACGDHCDDDDDPGGGSGR